MLAGPVVLARRLLERFVPRGALTLAILSLTYFGMGLIRNRVFANAFGAGPDLDAYSAAFRIPEIALDILVASGLSAPFVPIFSRLREDPDGARRAERFGRTVLTFAITVTSVAMGVLFVLTPWIAERVFTSFDAPTRDLYVELFRINCLAQVLFAGSIALGEVLVANRRFLFMASPRSCTRAGSSLAPFSSARRWGSGDRGSGRSRAPWPILGSGPPGRSGPASGSVRRSRSGQPSSASSSG